MSGNLTDEQVTEFKGSFSFFGSTGEDAIEKEDINKVMRSLGLKPSEEDISEMLFVIEQDGNPQITFPYFLSLMADKMQDSDSEQQLLSAFDVFDKHKNGQIAIEDFKGVVGNLGEKLTPNEIREIIREADKDGDGQIDYVEFVKMMMAK